MGRGKAIAIVGGAVVVAWVATEAYSIMTKAVGTTGAFAFWFAMLILAGGLAALAGTQDKQG